MTCMNVVQELPKIVIDQADVVLRGIDSISPIHRGLSRSSVYRIDSRSGRFALKSYAKSDFSFEKIAAVHRFQKHIFGSQILVCPRVVEWQDGVTVLGVDDAWWELSSWQPGKPIATIGQATEAQLLDACGTLGMIHAASRRLAVRDEQSVGVASRIQGLLQASQESLSRKTEVMLWSERDLDFANLIERYTWHVASRALFLIRQLNELGVRGWRCQWIVRDVWRDHVLFEDAADENRALSGIIDWSAAAMDVPILDVVRMLGTMLLPSDDRWQTSLTAYTATSNLQFTLEDVRDLDEASTILSARNWIKWTANSSGLSEHERNQAKSRWGEITRKLEEYQRANEAPFF
jgi:hypothetical protein